MGLVKWDPFKDLLFLQERMSRIFDEAFSHYKGGPSSTAWFPPVDIYETDDAIVLKAEIPGIDIENVAVEVEDNVVTLRGERKFERNLTEESCHRMERFYGQFQRVFSLPNPVDKGGVKASLRDGVLEISLPRTGAMPQGGIRIKVE